MRKALCGIVAALFCLAALPSGNPALGQDFVPLFDGKTLNGWKQLGGKAGYEVRDGILVGTSKKGEENSFLCTTRDYADFILELEFLVDAGMNSGIQIRSHAYERDQTIKVQASSGKEKTKSVKAGRVHGYQVEIDPSERAWTGGIYDEARRGWLQDLKDNEQGRKAFKQGEWNRFRIEARGDSMKVWLNGVLTADLKDDMTPSGFIALQVHGTKSDTPHQVRWRNIRIKEMH